jgi:hypothetical protein
MAYIDEVLADSPGGYWRMEEPSGTSADDASANTNTGTYINTPTLAEASLLTSDANTSVRFTRASSEYVTVVDHATLDLADIWTVEAWIKLAALGQATSKQIVSKQNGAYGVRVDTADRIQMMRSQTANLKHSDAALGTTGPHHIVCTKTGGTTAIYVNGSAVAATQDGLSTCANNALKLFVGVDGASDVPQGEYFDGWMDEVAVYPTALSAARVTAHYDAGVAAAILSVPLVMAPLVPT